VTAAVADLTGRRLRALLAREQAEQRLPSLVAAVVREGHVVWQGSHGSETGGPSVSEDLQYRIGSITKTMTAVLVLQLRDEGRLQLGDRLDQHLPGIGYGDRSIRSLMSHTTGMHSEPPGSWWERSPGVDFATLAARIADRPAPLPAGQQYHYSNVAWALLGELVARLRGGSWWEQVEQRILRPLGMSRTTYLPQQPAATGYSVHHFAGTLTEEPATDTGAMAPAGQVWSTVADLATYATFLTVGHEAVLAGSTVAEMTIPQSGERATGTGAGYGLGLRLLSGGSGTLVGHSGSMPGFLAGLFVDPVRRTGAVCFANATMGMRAEGLPLDLMETLEACEPTVVPVWEPVRDLPPHVAEVLGVWHWGHTAFGFSYDGDELVVHRLAGGLLSFRFRPAPDGRGDFIGTLGYHHGETLHVVRNDDGTVSHLECATFVFTREPYDREAPIPGGHPGPEVRWPG